MRYSLATAQTTHPSFLHFRRGENTENPPSLTREGMVRVRIRAYTPTITIFANETAVFSFYHPIFYNTIIP